MHGHKSTSTVAAASMTDSTKSCSSPGSQRNLVSEPSMCGRLPRQLTCGTQYQSGVQDPNRMSCGNRGAHHVADRIDTQVLIPTAQQYPRALRDLGGHARRFRSADGCCLSLSRRLYGTFLSGLVCGEQHRGGVSGCWAALWAEAILRRVVTIACAQHTASHEPYMLPDSVCCLPAWSGCER